MGGRQGIMSNAEIKLIEAPGTGMDDLRPGKLCLILLYMCSRAALTQLIMFAMLAV